MKFDPNYYSSVGRVSERSQSGATPLTDLDSIPERDNILALLRRGIGVRS